MSALVYMGEYSSACVCEVAGGGKSAPPTGAAAGAGVGVAMQMMRAAQQQRTGGN